jgi:hypothetical protein
MILGDLTRPLNSPEHRPSTLMQSHLACGAFSAETCRLVMLLAESNTAYPAVSTLSRMGLNRKEIPVWLLILSLTPLLPPSLTTSSVIAAVGTVRPLMSQDRAEQVPAALRLPPQHWRLTVLCDCSLCMKVRRELHTTCMHKHNPTRDHLNVNLSDIDVRYSCMLSNSMHKKVHCSSPTISISAMSRRESTLLLRYV